MYHLKCSLAGGPELLGILAFGSRACRFVRHRCLVSRPSCLCLDLYCPAAQQMQAPLDDAAEHLNPPRRNMPAKAKTVTSTTTVVDCTSLREGVTDLAHLAAHVLQEIPHPGKAARQAVRELERLGPLGLLCGLRHLIVCGCYTAFAIQTSFARCSPHYAESAALTLLFLHGRPAFQNTPSGTKTGRGARIRTEKCGFGDRQFNR